MSNRDCQENCPDGYLTFDDSQVDYSKSFDISTGTFTVPVDGSYMFLFTAFVYTNTHAGVGVHVNGESVEYFENCVDGNGYDGREFSASFSLDLKANDELRLDNTYNSSIFIRHDRRVHFMGALVN